MGVTRGERSAQLPQHQPAFELPFNEILGALTARQGRYDQVTEQAAAAKAALAKIQAIPGTPDEMYVKEKQRKLDELVNKYADSDLSKQPGVDMMKDVRTLALDPSLPKIETSFSGWNELQNNKEKLKLEGKYSPYFDDNRWQTWDSGKQGVFKGQIEGYEPDNLDYIFNNIQGVRTWDDVNKTWISTVTAEDVNKQAQLQAEYYVGSSDGRQQLKVYAQEVDPNAIAFNGKLYKDLSPVELSEDYLRNWGNEFINRKEGGMSKAVSSGSGQLSKYLEGLPATPTPTGDVIIKNPNVLSSTPTGAEALKITAVKNAERYMSGEKPNEYVNTKFQGLSLIKDADGKSVHNITPEEITAFTLHDFKVEEQADGTFKLKALPMNADVSAEDTKLVNDRLAKGTLDVEMAHYSGQIKQLQNEAKNLQQIDDQIRADVGMDKNFKVDKELLEEGRDEYTNAAINKLASSELDIYLTLKNAHDVKNPEIARGYNNRGITSLDYYESVLDYANSDEFITAMSEELINPKGISRYARVLTVPGSEVIKFPGNYKSTDEVKELLTTWIGNAKQEGNKTEAEFYSDKDPKYAAYSRTYRQLGEVITSTKGTFLFGTSPEGQRMDEGVTSLVQSAVINRTTEIRDVNTNAVVIDDDIKTKLAEGNIKVVGWRFDKDPRDVDGKPIGVAVDFYVTDKDKKPIGSLYEAGVIGISQYFKGQGAEREAGFIDNVANLYRKLDDSGGWIARDWSMGEGLTPVDVESLLTDDAAGHKKGTFRFTHPITQQPVYAENERDLMVKYLDMVEQNVTLQAYGAEINTWKSLAGYNTGAQVFLTDKEVNDAIATPGSIPTPKPITNELVKGIMEIESNFEATAFNDSSMAIGPMQIKPSTALDSGFGLPQVNPYIPADAVRFAKDYLTKNYELGGNDLVKAVIGYNQGPGYLQKWMASGGKWEQLNSEVQNYLTKLKAKGLIDLSSYGK